MHKYLLKYRKNMVLFLNIYEKKENETTSTLSDQISKDLKKKGMSFVGSITIYSYLEAIGIYNHHDRNCFLHL
jgi:DNA-3-methyladenine glycosylase I